MSDYRSSIDGLRAIAVFAVILYHTGNPNFSGLFVGVDIFFVISGFVVSKSILPGLREGDLCITDFYTRRIKRIAPAFFITIWATTPLVVYFMPEHYVTKYFESTVATVLCSSNMYFYKVTDYFENEQIPQVLLHTWTLAIEEQFYFILPIILRKFYNFAVPMCTVACLASFAFAELLTFFGYQQIAFYLLPFRAWEFLVGVLLALLEDRCCQKISACPGPFRAMSFVLLTASFMVFRYWSHHPGVLTTLPVLSAVLFIVVSRDETSILSLSGFVFTGKISYSLYLWHFPIFIIFGRFSVLGVSTDSYWKWTGPVLIVYVVSTVSWLIVEQPIRRASLSFSQAMIFWLVSIVLTITVSSSFLAKLNRDVHSRPVGTVDYYAKSYCPVRYCCEGGKPFTNISQLQVNDELKFQAYGTYCNPAAVHTHSCLLGNENLTATVALVGDSHAQHYHFGIHEALLHSNFEFAVESITIGGTPILKNMDCYTKGRLVSQGVRNVLRRIADPQYNTIILSNRWLKYAHGPERFDNFLGGYDYNSQTTICKLHGIEFNKQKLLEEFTATIEYLLSLGKSVVLMYPVPEAGWDVPMFMKRRRQSGQNSFVSTGLKTFTDYASSVLDAFDKLYHPRLFKVFPHHVLCDGQTFVGYCLIHDCRHIYYWDSNHLSVEGADLVIPQIIDALREINSRRPMQ